MARSRTLRRSRNRVSYAESFDGSTSGHDEDFVQVESSPVRRRNFSQRSGQHNAPKLRQRETASRPAQTPKQLVNRTRRTTVPRISYAESTSPSDDSDSELLVSRGQKRKPSKAADKRPSRRRDRRSESQGQNPPRGRPSKRARIAPRPKEPLVHKKIESDGRIPAWTTLPYEILLSIFQHAVNPLHEEVAEGLKPTANVNWAVNVARTCKAFAEPALTALYECPPIHFQTQPFELFDLLSSPIPTTIDYGAKIRRLYLDSRQTLAYATTNRGRFPLAELLQLTPRLQEVEIVSHINRPPFFSHLKRGLWHYSPEMFRVMNDHGIKLKSWRWCGDKLGSLEVREILGRFAYEPCLQSLKHLTLSHLTFPENDLLLPAQHTSAIILPQALTELKELCSLTIATCDVFSWEILTHLPRKLESLSVISCPDFTPKTLNTFLSEHGQELRQLDVSHNNLIDLSFLPDLKINCPKLQYLKMDAMYYSTALMFKSADAEPRYDTVLLPGAIPSWPSTLQEIELLSLRKWHPDAAAAFFQSLVDSSGELPYLRSLTIRAMLDIDWRNRAEFRDKYIGRLEQVFLRQAPDPNPHLASFKSFRLWKEGQEQIEVEAEAKPKTRAADRRKLRAQLTEDDEVDEEEDEDEDEEVFIQGLCETVDINIDNMRPTEHQFKEDDFMDSEVSGDEEWTGVDNEVQLPTRHAWR